MEDIKTPPSKSSKSGAFYTEQYWNNLVFVIQNITVLLSRSSILYVVFTLRFPDDVVPNVSLGIKPYENIEHPNQNENLQTVEIENLRISDKLTFKDTEPNSVLQVPVQAVQESVDDPTSISEAGRFSLAAVFALSLSHLFESKWDEDFCLRSNKTVVNNLHLPRRVRIRKFYFPSLFLHASTETTYSCVEF